MAYSRGSRDDFDRWADVTGDGGWSWDALQPYMRKVRRVPFSAKVHYLFLYTDSSIERKIYAPNRSPRHFWRIGYFSTRKRWYFSNSLQRTRLTCPLHNVGPLGFSVENVMLPTVERVINATGELEGFPFNLDYNTGDTIGIGELATHGLFTFLFLHTGWFQATVKLVTF